jgi:hypothetical protein
MSLCSRRQRGKLGRVNVKAAKPSSRTKGSTAEKKNQSSRSTEGTRARDTPTGKKAAVAAHASTGSETEEQTQDVSSTANTAVLEQQKIMRAKVTARMKSKRKRDTCSTSTTFVVQDTSSMPSSSVSLAALASAMESPQAITPALSTKVKVDVDEEKGAVVPSPPATAEGCTPIKKEPCPGTATVPQSQGGAASQAGNKDIPRSNKRQKKTTTSAEAKKEVESGDDDGEKAAESTDPAECKKQRRLIRNRMSAQLHRERQKAHVTDLQSQVQAKVDELGFAARQIATAEADKEHLVCYATYLETLLSKHLISFQRTSHVKSLLPVPAVKAEAGSCQTSPSYSSGSDTTPYPSSPENDYLSSVVCIRAPPTPRIKKERLDSGDESLRSSSDQTTSEASPPPMTGSSVLLLAVMFTMFFFSGKNDRLVCVCARACVRVVNLPTHSLTVLWLHLITCFYYITDA